MSLSHKLELRQGQALVMTPQLQQAIRLLHLSNLELNAFVESELERNPLLERDANPEPGTAEPEPPPEPAPAASESADVWLETERPVAEVARDLDTEAENVFPDAAPGDLDDGASLGNWASVRQRGQGGDGEGSNIESYVSAEPTLKDHLTEQMALLLSDPVERFISAYLVDLVDEAGYLRASTPDIAAKLGTAEATVEAVVAKMQTLDPPGVCARSLSECLALQLKERNRYDEVIARLLDNLDLLGSHNMAGLRRAVGVDLDELSEMISELKALNPKPGLRFGRVEIEPVVPDVIVRAASDGGWIVELNSETLPRVLVNRSYYARVSTNSRSADDKGYLLECLQTANWLVKSLDQRARTILKVAEEIIRQQDGFLMYGVQHLRPLNLKTVADAIKMHESTVSRVTSNKYMATPRGIFELKFFFTSAIQSAGDGEAHSSEAVRHRIKQLIDAEPVDAVLSDDRIVELLHDDGVEIARRTVAKYREAMRIPSSVQRRREKRMLSRTVRC
ncbi:MAG: RNA polymerase factor sigma-54 [Hyphomicrobiaceae bacterium]